MRTRKLNRKMAGVLLLVFVVGMGVASLPAARATQPQGPVTIQTHIDFSGLPFHGTFSVPVGPSILGCSQGLFSDTTGLVPGELRKVFSCDNGAGRGDTFTFLFDTDADAFSGGHATGHWAVFEGTGFFLGLRGQGDFSLEIISPTSGIETLTGEVHFE